MSKEYVPYFKIKIPKADKQPIETYTDRELKVLLKKPIRKRLKTRYNAFSKT